jgi:hypothetical protein
MKVKNKYIRDRYGEDARNVAGRCVAEGGWSSIISLVNALPDNIFEQHFYWLFEDEDEEYEEEQNEII